MAIAGHTPVLLTEVMNVLAPMRGDRVLDVTLGLGGHASTFFKAIGGTGELVGLDADMENLEAAREKLSHPNVTLLHANFGEVGRLSLGVFDVVFADLGLSSPHVDDPLRGFTYRTDAPLDLRFDRTHGHTAAELLSSRKPEVVTDWLRTFGELRQAGRLARELIAAKPQTTGQVKAIVEQVSGRFAVKILPLVFQALRIAVNDEMRVLDRFLEALPNLLRKGGRAGIIAYHSLEDRPVKQRFRELSTPLKDDITGAVAVPAAFELLTKKAIMPSEQEIAENPRSRSAKLRAIRREKSTSVVHSHS